MKARRLAWTGIGVVLATVGALLQTPAQPPRQTSITALLPAGATLVLQAKDFASLVGDWNTSAEKTKWLASANYEAFSRSRLFLRLKEAYDEFSTAAGVPPDMALVSDVAGAESALALYDIGKLEFLYVTRLPSARAMENALWRTRGDLRAARGRRHAVLRPRRSGIEARRRIRRPRSVSRARDERRSAGRRADAHRRSGRNLGRDRRLVRAIGEGGGRARRSAARRGSEDAGQAAAFPLVLGAARTSPS